MTTVPAGSASSFSTSRTRSIRLPKGIVSPRLHVGTAVPRVGVGGCSVREVRETGAEPRSRAGIWLPVGTLYERRATDSLPCRRVGTRILHGHGGIGISHVVFDMLACDGEATIVLPYREGRAVLERLSLAAAEWCPTDVYEGGERLFAAVVEQGLDGDRREAAG